MSAPLSLLPSLSPSLSFSPSPFSGVVLVLEKETLALASDITKIKIISEKKKKPLKYFWGLKRRQKELASVVLS